MLHSLSVAKLGFELSQYTLLPLGLILGLGGRCREAKPWHVLLALTRRQTASTHPGRAWMCVAGSVVTLQDNLFCQKQSRMGHTGLVLSLDSALPIINGMALQIPLTCSASVSPGVK